MPLDVDAIKLRSMHTSRPSCIILMHASNLTSLTAYYLLPWHVCPECKHALNWGTLWNILPWLQPSS